MQHDGGCHCGNLQVHVRLTKPPAENAIRSCACSFCRSHNTRTVSDPAGQVDIRASEWSLVERYRFGSRTADYLFCRRCGVYIGAVCDTAVGPRAVVNTLCLTVPRSPTMPCGRTTMRKRPRRVSRDARRTGCRRSCTGPSGSNRRVSSDPRTAVYVVAPSERRSFPPGRCGR
jgi:hypothetical protein